MKRLPFNELQLWQFDNLSSQKGIRHFVTDRVSAEGITDHFTLSFSSHPDRDFIHQNRALLSRAMGVAPELLFFPSQVHETRIVTVTPDLPREELQNTDALITHHNGVCIAVLSADCVPVLLYDTVNKVVAAVHSGWRGTVAQILSKTLERLKQDYGTRGEDVIAAIGPSVCQESYEVGAEVIARVDESFGANHDLMIRTSGDKAQLDLWMANKIQLVAFGVPPGNIEVSDLCTVKNNSHFYSARKGDSGRFAAGIMLT